ncbi:uncharacterized protein AB9X84_015512 [Acanthopagrus schlegelii]
MHLLIWFGFCLFSLYSLPVTTGQSNLICSTQPIVAHAGDDVILSCRLDPPISASSRTVEWTKPGLDPEYIHLHQDGRLVYQSQNPLYNYRTALFVDQLIHGNVSMKIFRVKTSDAGKYKCFLPSFWKEAFIELKIEDDFMDPSSCTPCISIGVLLGVMFILAVVLLVWKWKQSNIETKKKNEEKELKKMEDLDKILPKLNEELQNKDEEQKDMTKIIEVLKEVSYKLVRQKERLTVQQQKAEKMMDENEKKVKSVEQEVTEKEGDKTVNRAQGYLKLKEIIQEANWNLEGIKKEHQQLNMNAENLFKSVLDAVNKTSERKEQVESHMQQIKKQKEEKERQREEIQRKLQSETTKLVN